MKNQLCLLKTVVKLLWNKGIALLALVFLIYRYLHLPSGGETPTPFVELLYAGILVSAIIVIAPVVRLLVFPTAAKFVENGGLKDELQKRAFTPFLTHYWFATAISYALTALCISSLLSF